MPSSTANSPVLVEAEESVSAAEIEEALNRTVLFVSIGSRRRPSGLIFWQVPTGRMSMLIARLRDQPNCLLARDLRAACDGLTAGGESLAVEFRRDFAAVVASDTGEYWPLSYSNRAWLKAVIGDD